MPMYFPDLASVRSCAEAMSQQPNPTKRYRGIIPATDADLPRARVELGRYMRATWGEIEALEIELAVTKDDYREKINQSVMLKLAALGLRR